MVSAAALGRSKTDDMQITDNPVVDRVNVLQSLYRKSPLASLSVGPESEIVEEDDYS